MTQEENQITLMVANDGPYLTLAALAEGARRLLKEEFLAQAHPNSQTWLHDQAWWQVYVEVTFQKFRLIPARPRQVETCDEFLQEVADIADVPHHKDAVRAVIQMIERGDDLTALLSKRATEPKQGRGDAFLADCTSTTSTSTKKAENSCSPTSMTRQPD